MKFSEDIDMDLCHTYKYNITMDINVAQMKMSNHFQVGYKQRKAAGILSDLNNYGAFYPWQSK